MGYNYRYTISYWDELDACDVIETGFVCGDNTVDVISKLVTMYGEDYIDMISIAYHSEGDGIIVDEYLGLSDELIKAHAEKIIETAGGFANAQ